VALINPTPVSYLPGKSGTPPASDTPAFFFPVRSASPQGSPPPRPLPKAMTGIFHECGRLPGIPRINLPGSSWTNRRMHAIIGCLTLGPFRSPTHFTPPLDRGPGSDTFYSDEPMTIGIGTVPPALRLSPSVPHVPDPRHVRRPCAMDQVFVLRFASAQQRPVGA
jgi:hypothetical protein